MQKKTSKSVLRLIELGMCQPSDIEKAKEDSRRFNSPEFSTRIRKAERLLGAVGDSTRIKMLLLLSSREMCVCELESALGLPQPTASHHLSLLEAADLVERTKNGRWVFYKVRQSPALDFLENLMSE